MSPTAIRPGWLTSAYTPAHGCGSESVTGDLGMLKSIGMTPRQVVVMVVSSMAALGAAGGLLAVPVGMLAHRLVIPVAARAAQVNIPESLLTVWQAPMAILLVLAGIAIAGLGALFPARAAARLTIAEVRTE